MEKSKSMSVKVVRCVLLNDYSTKAQTEWSKSNLKLRIVNTVLITTPPYRTPRN